MVYLVALRDADLRLERRVVRRVDLLRVVLLVVLRTRPLVALRADLLLRVVLLAPLALFLAAILLMPPSC